jgi:hypothetical protein
MPALPEPTIPKPITTNPIVIKITGHANLKTHQPASIRALIPNAARAANPHSANPTATKPFF